MTLLTPVVGIDLSLSQTGVAILHGGKVTTNYLNVKPVASEDRYLSKLLRFEKIGNGLLDMLDETIQPWTEPHIFLEGPAYQSKGSSGHDIAGNWWLFYQSLVANGMSPHIIPPSTVKQYATGKGNANKDAVMAAVIRRYLDIDIPNNDVADAVTLMALGARYFGQPIEADLPKLNLKALEKL